MPERTGELVAFANAALPGMQLADGAFCHELVAPGERRSGGRLGRGTRVAEDGESQRFGRSLRYTLMVLIGAERARAAGVSLGLDLGAAWAAAEGELETGPAGAGDCGLALWAASVAGREPAAAAERLARACESTPMETLEGHELAWMVIGCARAARAPHANGAIEERLELLAGRLAARAHTPSGLLRRTDGGRTARFPHFATQIYGILAFVEAASAGASGSPLGVAGAVADRVLALQRADGAWPWLYDAVGGGVVEPYRLYSVHQDAMAPMALGALSAATGDERYRAAAAAGLAWVFGANELSTAMLDERQGMLYRSINRRGVGDRAHLWARMARVAAGLPAGAPRSSTLEVERTDRPYHLGWVLEAWADSRLPS